MKIALVSAEFINKDTAYNLAQIIRFMRDAKEQGADLVCFGEAFLQGFDAYCWDYEKDRKLAVSLDSLIFRRLCEETRRLGIDLMLGFLEADGDKLYSSCALVANGEVLHLYRRISKGWKVYWKTDEHYCEGDEVQTFEYRGRKCLVALCGDLWDFPDRFRLGQELLFWPVYINYSPDEWFGGEREEYARQACKACGNALLINSIDATSAGGCYHFVDGKVQNELRLGAQGLLLVEV